MIFLFYNIIIYVIGYPTELPDSLEDSAIIAATACQEFSTHTGTPARCRIDFDTSVGDETYTTLKSSTEFMQKFVSAVCYAMIPGLMEQRQQQMMKVVQARAEIQQLMSQTTEMDFETVEKKKEELMWTIPNGGKDGSSSSQEYNGPLVRIYFPEKGNAALGRRDWTQIDPEMNKALAPSCIQFSSLGDVQLLSQGIGISFCGRDSV